MIREAVRGTVRAGRVAGYRLGKSLLRGLGYDVQVVRSSGGPVADTDGMEDSHLYREWTTPVAVWTPWLGDEGFRAAFEGVSPHTVVTVDRCHVLYSLARQAARLEGEFAEAGVFNGGTALLLARVASQRGRSIHLFDSFEGLPEPNGDYDSGFQAGDFRSASADAVRSLLAEIQSPVEIHVGFVPATFAGLEDREFSFVHIDVDLYQSCLDACEFFYPRLVPGAVMAFDDHGFPDTRGMRHAVEEFFADKPEVPLALPTGQAFVTRLPDGDDS